MRRDLDVSVSTIDKDNNYLAIKPFVQCKASEWGSNRRM
jgi:hypothetical protein